MPARIIATYKQPVEQFGAIPDGPYTGPGAIAAAFADLDRAFSAIEQFGVIPDGPYVSPGVTVEVECGPDTIAAAMTALDRAVADVKAQLAAADPMRVIESAPPAQDTPRT